MDKLYKYEFFNESSKKINEGESIMDAFVVVFDGDTPPANYIDFNGIENWINYGKSICSDDLQLRDRILQLLNTITWSSLNDVEKDIVISFNLRETAVDDATYNTNKITYLMGKGNSLEESKIILLKSYAEFHIKEVVACKKRSDSGKMYEIIAKYLQLSDAGDLIKITHKLFDLYKTQAIRGTEDGNAGEGLFNFLESTVGTSYENSGLEEQGYTLNSGTYTEFITELMGVLREGKY